jgi:hypothetical protein
LCRAALVGKQRANRGEYRRGYGDVGNEFIFTAMLGGVFDFVVVRTVDVKAVF